MSNSRVFKTVAKSPFKRVSTIVELDDAGIHCRTEVEVLSLFKRSDTSRDVPWHEVRRVEAVSVYGQPFVEVTFANDTWRIRRPSTADAQNLAQTCRTFLSSQTDAQA